jgi:hypothetical protein
MRYLNSVKHCLRIVVHGSKISVQDEVVTALAHCAVLLNHLLYYYIFY